MATIYSVILGGDKLEIFRNGNVFFTSDGQSHSTLRRSQIEEVRKYYGSFHIYFPEAELERMVDCDLIFVLDQD